MFLHISHLLLRRVTPHKLRLRLRRLREISKTAEGELHKRRHSVRKAKQEETKDNSNSNNKSNSSSYYNSSSSSSSSSPDSGVHVKWLPKNEALESAIALAISENRDARTELEFMRHFLKSSLISLASPVGTWDPYDTKPQVFALDKYIALPVFTSLAYLRLFCMKFNFVVRDPSGVLWVDGPYEAAEEEKRGKEWSTKQIPLPDVSKSEWWARHVQQHFLSTALESGKSFKNDQEVYTTNNINSTTNNNNSWINATDLFDSLETDLQQDNNINIDNEINSIQKEKKNIGNSKNKRKRSLKRSKNRGRKNKFTLKNKKNKGTDNKEGEKDNFNNYNAVHEAFWTKVKSISPFNISKATPLPLFGPLIRPFFVGYFADIDTLLHNASIVPEKVDIILNPSSPIEFVLSREATDRVLHKDQLLFLTYRRVEKELCGEFHRFFLNFTPEVVWARSACIPCPIPGKPDEIKYEIVILLESDDFNKTFSSFREAKHLCLLIGHSELDVIPWSSAAPYVQEASTLFYKRKSLNEEKSKTENISNLGIFEQRGPIETINVLRSAESYFYDPSAAYTESHAVFTEELKVKKRIR